jgi:cadmium resistance protein CadD (predicted permease)
MHSWLVVLAASVTTFAATNVDNFFVLILFFARRIPVRRIVAGQYLGFSVIIVGTLTGIWAAQTVPRRWFHAFGLFPIVIGLKHFYAARKRGVEQSREANPGLVSIAFVVFSNGADNIGVYVPFFMIARPRLWFILVIYAALVSIWCLLSGVLGNHRLIVREVDRWGHWIMPVVLVALGIYVLRS